MMFINAKTVTKPWGNEVWISDGTQMPYALKKITFLAGNRSSLQVHRLKAETNHVLSGEGLLILGKYYFHVDDYTSGKMSKEDLDVHLSSFDTFPLSAGMSFNVLPRTIHRVVALTDLVFIEASTPDLDDVIRLEDDTNRGNGKIDAEHA